MRKICISAGLITAMLLTGFSCKKSSKSTSSNDPTPTTPVVMNQATAFSVNGASEDNLTVVKGTTSNNNSYEFLVAGTPWTIGVIFSGSNTPVSGTYAIEDSTDINIPAGQCTIFTAGPDSKYGRPHSGAVTVTTGATNKIEFSNIEALQKDLSNNVTATYTLSGVIRY